MLSLELLTSSSDSNLNLICDLKHIAEIARVSKTNYIYLSKRFNKIFSTNEEPYCIHEIDIPYLVNTDLLIFAPNFDADGVLSKYENFFIPHDFQWVILPDIYWDMYCNGDIIPRFSYEKGCNELLDKSTMVPIDVIYLWKPEQSYIVSLVMNTIDSFINTKNDWYYIGAYNNLHLNEKFKRVFFEEKVSFGSIPISLPITEGSDPITFYFFKGMVSLNKSDFLNAAFFKNKMYANKYMVVLTPTKKKDPIKGNKYGIPFIEQVYFCYLNIND